LRRPGQSERALSAPREVFDDITTNEACGAYHQAVRLLVIRFRIHRAARSLKESLWMNFHTQRWSSR
jgi:hypothetical protein